MHRGANGFPLVDDFRDVFRDLFPAGEGAVRATYPHTEDVQGGAVGDDVCTLEAVQELGEGGVESCTSYSYIVSRMLSSMFNKFSCTVLLFLLTFHETCLFGPSN